MPQTAKNEGKNAPIAQELSSPHPWHRLEGESLLWFNRFKRYRELGPKRSLQAAVEQEHRQITALKSPRTAQKQGEVKRRPKKSAAASHLTEVPPVKSVQVPGSWKQASIRWSWVERARAYDSYQLDYVFEQSNALFFASDDIYTLPVDRISALQAMFKSLLENYNANGKLMTYDQQCTYMARMQSILRDIREEVKLMESDFIQKMSRKRLEHWQKNGEKVFAPRA